MIDPPAGIGATTARPTARTAKALRNGCITGPVNPAERWFADLARKRRVPMFGAGAAREAPGAA